MSAEDHGTAGERWVNSRTGSVAHILTANAGALCGQASLHHDAWPDVDETMPTCRRCLRVRDDERKKER